MSKLNILLVGTGAMAGEHARTLIQGLGANVTVTARNKERLKKFHEDFNTNSWHCFEDLKSNDFNSYDGAIIASSVDSLEKVTRQLIDNGLKRILVEKPATLNSQNSLELHQFAIKAQCHIRVAYNRRYYSSVLKLKEILLEEKPIAGYFDFTEWPDRVLSVPMEDDVKARLAIANSGHVIDTLEFLLGSLKLSTVSVTGIGHLDWHPSGATFVGAGLSNKVPVAYCTSWESAGRWNIEISTLKGKYKLSPMEQLQFLPLKSIHWEQVNLESGNTDQFKPGLLAMLSAFFSHPDSPSTLPDLAENAALLKNIELIAGYQGQL
jgi:predicted dehydrogenase